MAEYVEHYNEHRPHCSLELPTATRADRDPCGGRGEVVCRTRVHGLINEYSLQAA